MQLGSGQAAPCALALAPATLLPRLSFCGGPKLDPYFWGSSTSRIHFHSPLGMTASQQEESPAFLGGVPGSEGGSVPVTAAP